MKVGEKSEKENAAKDEMIFQLEKSPYLFNTLFSVSYLFK